MKIDYYLQTCSIRNSKGNASESQEITVDGNLNSQEGRKFSKIGKKQEEARHSARKGFTSIYEV